MKRFLLSVFWLGFLLSGFGLVEGASIVEENPQLKKFLYEEPRSSIFFGFGVTPFGIVKSKPGFALHILEIHWMEKLLDWDLFTASFSMTVGASGANNIKNFTFWTAPKYRATSLISVGPLFGYEFSYFPDVLAKLNKPPYGTPTEHFTSQGAIYGIDVSETMEFKKKYFFKADQIAYKQSYSTDHATNGWKYLYIRNDINSDHSLIDPGFVFLLQFSFLY